MEVKLKYLVSVRRLFYTVLFMFPFLFAVLTGLIYIGGGQQIIGWKPNEHFLLPDIEHVGICIIILGIVLVSIHHLINKCKGMKLTCIVIFLSAYLLRVGVWKLWGDQVHPFSDFDVMWNLTNGITEQLNYHQYFPAWVNWATVVYWIKNITGDSYAAYLFTNCIMDSISTVCIYLIASKLLHDNIGKFAAVFYMIFPANIIYHLIAVPEFLTIMLYLVSIVIFCYMPEGKSRFLLLAISGILLGISGAIKPFAIVILIAGVITILFSMESLVQKFKKITIWIFIMALCMAVSNSMNAISEQKYHVELDNSTATMHWVLVGLNTEGEGQIHIGSLSRLYLNNLMDGTMSKEEASKYAFDVLKNDWRNNSEEIVPLFIKKLIWAWQDHVIPVYYLFEELGIDSDETISGTIFSLSKKYLPGLSQIFYVVVMIFGSVGIFIITKKYIHNEGMFFVSMIIWGYFCLMILSESQSRYKVLVVPLLCIVAGIGYDGLQNKIKDYIKFSGVISVRNHKED